MKKQQEIGRKRKECVALVRKHHAEEIPEHPVIWAMERFGEYPPPGKKKNTEEGEDGQLTVDSAGVW